MFFMNRQIPVGAFLIILLRAIALVLRLCKIFLPGIIIVIGTGWLMTRFIQGRDVIIITLESSWRGLFFMTALLFWATVSWYSSRLIAYNQDELFDIFPNGLYHAPRILGFTCFTVVMLSFLAIEPLDWGYEGILIFISLQVLMYIVGTDIFEQIRDQQSDSKLIKIRNIATLLSGLIFGIASIRNDLVSYLIALPFLQLTLMFLVVVRRKIKEEELLKQKNTEALKEQRGYSYQLLKWILSNEGDQRSDEHNNMILKGEISIFRTFNIVAIISISIWFAAIFHLATARFISTLPIVLLALGVLLGVGNLISLFSVKTRTNLHLLFIAATFAIGLMFEPHNVRRTWPTDPSVGNNFANRPDLDNWFHAWTAERMDELSDRNVTEYPVFLLLADGGASRSAYWAAGVWSKLEEATQGRFSKHLLCLSGTSGGSLGNAAFFSMLSKGRQHGEIQETRKESQTYLSQDFLSHTMARLLGPDLLKPLFPLDIIYDRAAALEQSMEKVPMKNRIAEQMSKPFSVFCPPGKTDLPILFLNTTRMQDGRPAVVSNIKVDEAVYGSRMDVLSTLPSYDDIRLSTAVVLGARFPYISPAGRLEDNYFVDGGYFDNSGAGVVHETLIELRRIIDDSLKKDSHHCLKKLKFYVLHATNATQDEAVVHKVHPIVNDLFAPVKTLLGAYSAQTHVNNSRLSRYLLSFPEGTAAYIKFNLYRPGEQDNIPMNWVISRENLRRMDKKIASDSNLNALIDKLNVNGPRNAVRK
jgi:predicted acylesterase/phospholipase RssA